MSVSSSAVVSVLAKNACDSEGRGLFWDEKSHRLYYIDIDTGSVQRYDTVKKSNEKITLDGQVTFLIPVDAPEYSDFIVGNGRNLTKFSWSDARNTAKVLHEVDHGLPTRFNDAKCDSRGRLWAGTMATDYDVTAVSTAGQGSLYRLNADQSLTKGADNIVLSSGIAWNADETKLFLSDSIARLVYVFDYDASTGNASNRRVLMNFEQFKPANDFGLPDGMTADVDGHLWIACYGASKVTCFDPETCKPLESVTLPASNITSCCFGGAQFNELFVSSSTLGLSEEQKKAEPLAGSIFSATKVHSHGSRSIPFRG